MQSQSVQIIFSDRIDIAPGNMRNDIDRDELHVLAQSIKENGLIAPITIRPRGDRYELVAGQRRLLACRIAGLIRIPCVVSDLDDKKALDIMAAENLERRDVDPVDEANFIKRLMVEQQSSVSEIAERINRTTAYVRDRLIIAEMPEYLQLFLKGGQIKIGVALLLMRIEPDEKRNLWARMAVSENANVRTVEYWVYQHELGLLPGVVQDGDSVPTAPDGAPHVQTLRCAIDGKDYPAKACKAVFIYEGNEQMLHVLRTELNASPAPSESSPN